MAELPIRLLGKSFNIVCSDGEKVHISRLVEYLRQRIDEVTETSRDSNSHYILLMSALLVCDDLFATRAELEKMLTDAKEKAVIYNNKPDGQVSGGAQELVSGLEQTVRSLEALCKRLEIE